jgi:hypothetical protein
VDYLLKKVVDRERDDYEGLCKEYEKLFGKD